MTAKVIAQADLDVQVHPHRSLSTGSDHLRQLICPASIPSTQTANHQAQLAAANQRTVAADGRAVVADERIAELEARVQSVRPSPLLPSSTHPSVDPALLGLRCKLSREYQDDDHHLSQARTHLDKFVAKRPDWSEMGFDDDEADVRSEKRRRT